MKKLFFFLIISSFLSNSFAQNYSAFTKVEEDLISTEPDKMMRVYNLGKSSDSIVLKSISTEINPTDKLTTLLADRMLLSVQDPNNSGVGIAAPQVGINRRLIVVQRFDKAEKPFEIFVNPKILWASKLMQLGGEGDLSFEERGQVMRHYSVEIQYQDLKGETITEILEGFTAVIFQHERDHLDGILLTDRLKEQKEIEFIPSEKEASLFFEKQNQSN